MRVGVLGPGVRVGHWTDPGRRTGTTVVVPDRAAVAAVDVRGNAPATRETDALAPWRLVERADAVVLSGGSALGLGTAHSVAVALRQEGRGVPTPAGPVPIVPAACVFDLVASGGTYPPQDAGTAALAAATTEPGWGLVGAGAGTTVGKHLGAQWSVPGGVGAALELAGAVEVGAVVVVNALGDVVDHRGDPLAASQAAPGATAVAPLDPAANTTVGVVTVDAALTKTEAHVVAQVAQDGYARSLRPSHTRYDGDAIFVLATGQGPRPGSIAAVVDAVVAAVADVVSAATRHAVTASRTGVDGPGAPAAEEVRRDRT